MIRSDVSYLGISDFLTATEHLAWLTKATGREGSRQGANYVEAGAPNLPLRQLQPIGTFQETGHDGPELQLHHLGKEATQVHNGPQIWRCQFQVEYDDVSRLVFARNDNEDESIGQVRLLFIEFGTHHTAAVVSTRYVRGFNDQVDVPVFNVRASSAQDALVREYV